MEQSRHRNTDKGHALNIFMQPLRKFYRIINDQNWKIVFGPHKGCQIGGMWQHFIDDCMAVFLTNSRVASSACHVVVVTVICETDGTTDFQNLFFLSVGP